MDCAFDEVAFDAVAFDVCVTPPPAPVGNHRGGAIIYVVHEVDDPLKRKRKREDEEILVL